MTRAGGAPTWRAQLRRTVGEDDALPFVIAVVEDLIRGARRNVTPIALRTAGKIYQILAAESERTAQGLAREGRKRGLLLPLPAPVPTLALDVGAELAKDRAMLGSFYRQSLKAGDQREVALSAFKRGCEAAGLDLDETVAAIERGERVPGEPLHRVAVTPNGPRRMLVPLFEPPPAA